MLPANSKTKGAYVGKSNAFVQTLIDARTAELASKRHSVAEQKSQLLSYAQHIDAQVRQLPQLSNQKLDDNTRALAQTAVSIPFAARADWDDGEWERWSGEKPDSVAAIRVGSFCDVHGEKPILLPAMVPFIGGNRTYLIRSTSPERSLQLFQSLILRTALMLPHISKYVLIDPATAGRPFSIRRALPLVDDNPADTPRMLEAVQDNIQRIIREFLDTTISSFEEIPVDIRDRERYTLVFAANFPSRYDSREINALMHIGNNGPVAGTYTFLHIDENAKLPHGFTF